MSEVHAGGTMGDMIVTALNRFPERTAFIAGERCHTYRDTSASVSLAIQALKKLGLQKGDAVAQISRNRPEQWFVMAACYLAGLKSASLHALGGLADHAHIINDSDSVVVLYDEDFSSQVNSLKQTCPAVRHWLPQSAEAGGFWSMASLFQPRPLVNETSAEDVIRLAYTGGTTGQPKGVMLSSRAMLHQAMLGLLERDWPPDPVFLCASPISHGAGANILQTLARGGTFILLPGFNVDTVLDAIEKLEVSVLYTVPTMLYALVDRAKVRKPDLSSLRMITYGASPAAPARIREALEVFGPILCQNYGQSEAPSTITVLRACDHLAEDPQRLASCGVPFAGLQVALLDGACSPVPEGDVGEICVRGPIVMSGYWKKPELTEQAFRGGWLHTGDLARKDAQGYYYIVDRMKDMIISGGFNVYPKEIEDVLASHPGVSAAAVIAVPDPKWGEAVKAIVVARNGASVDAKELMQWVRDRKGPVGTPKSVDFVDSLPLTSVGKPDKEALRKPYWTGHRRGVN